VAYTEDNAFELIQSAYQRQRLGHAYLIIGEKHAGTHRLASRLVDLINAEPQQNEGLDLFGEATVQANGEPKSIDELEGELVRLLRPEKKSRIISVDAMRTFERSLYTTAPDGLKTLEEPPKRTLLILLTNQPDRLLPTILSRCVNINLIATQQAAPSESETALLQSIATHCKGGFSSDISALKMKAVFATILAERKVEISKANDIALKAEEAMYAKTTEGSWLKERKEYYKAQTESEYLLERTLLMNTLVSWLGDIVRAKSGHSHLDYPQIKTLTHKLSESQEMNQLLQRMENIEKLRDALTTNADEKLALEVGFMNAFG